MKEKELRLAVVLCGGVSLALYEHGVTKEILKLARASKAYHAGLTTEIKQQPERNFRAVGGDKSEYCTEEVYFDFLKVIGRTLDLRVIIDVIAGASAGGINGIALARAVAHDLSLSPLTEMWLTEADMQRLLAPKAKARRWSKWYFWPFIHALFWRLSREPALPEGLDAESRERLATFLRSRWFNPPLDGERLTNILLDGFKAMGAPDVPSSSLLPAEHKLSLLVTVTDFYGFERTIFMHDPRAVQELEHRGLLRFTFRRSEVGEGEDDFDDPPSLAFAGRATASYPGAFPPAQIREIDAVLAQRKETWPKRAHFLYANFRRYQELGLDPEDAVFLDGGVLDNKPVFAAIEAIHTHPAFTEVDRRLVYVDPNPAEPLPESGLVPDFFSTLRAALSDLPRHESIYGELAELSGLNDQVRNLKRAIVIARPDISQIVDEVTQGRLKRRELDAADMRRWRMNILPLMAKTGPQFRTWLGLMFVEVTEFLTRVTSDVCGYPPGSPEARWVMEVIEAWAKGAGLMPQNYTFPHNMASEADLPPDAYFLASFGVQLRRRRLIFEIQTINNLYAKLGEPAFCATSPATLDLLKRRLHRCLDMLDIFDGTNFVAPELMEGIRAIFRGTNEIDEKIQGSSAEAFAKSHHGQIGGLFDALRDACDLVGATEDADAVMVSPTVLGLDAACRRELLVSYIGFVFWDMILLPITSALKLDVGTLEEILVDRISPEDAVSIKLDGGGSVLRGAAFAGFGGFLNRAAREADYLWGRLHGVDRLFDILASAGASQIAEARVDLQAFKRRAFEMILDAEAPRLPQVQELISRIRAALAKF